MNLVAPAATRAVLRRACDGEGADEALELLARLRDPADEERIVKWIAADGEGVNSDAAALWGTPAVVQAFLAQEDADEGMLALSQCGFRFGVEEDDPGYAEWKRALARGQGLPAARKLLLMAPERHRAWNLEGRRKDQPWIVKFLRRCYETREHEHGDRALGTLAMRDPDARAEYWSAMRAGRYRWINDWQDTEAMTLGFDWATLPFWAEELESNCCRINPRIDSMFDDLFGIDDLYGANDYGVGIPPSRRVRAWFELYGGEPRWSKLARMCLPVPE